MKINSNYSITQLFVKKEVIIIVDNKKFTLKIPTIRDLYEDEKWSSILFFWTRPLSDTQKIYFKAADSALGMIKLIIFDAVQFQEYSELTSLYKIYLEKWIPNIEYDYENRELKVDDITITPDVWDYILYLLKLSSGEKVTQPPVFDSEEARKLYLAQQEQEEKIRKIKSQGNQGQDGLIKVFLAITYAFPSLTIDYLFDQTMAQIQWLQKYAAGAVSYEVNAKAYAAGNVKKGKRLDFFIK